MTKCLLGLVVLAGCWTQHDPQQPLPSMTAPVENRAAIVARTPRDHRSIWVGRYHCLQGITGIRLTIDRTGDGLAATFEFGPIAENPALPEGSFRMTGTVTRVADGTKVQLQPTEWLSQPANYVMVGIEAVVTDGRLLRGRISHAGCGSIEATRVD